MTMRPWPKNCCLWCKGTNFQANHNINDYTDLDKLTVAYGVKVLISKQITTFIRNTGTFQVLLLMV